MRGLLAKLREVHFSAGIIFHSWLDPSRQKPLVNFHSAQVVSFHSPLQIPDPQGLLQGEALCSQSSGAPIPGRQSRDMKKCHFQAIPAEWQVLEESIIAGTSPADRGNENLLPSTPQPSNLPANFCSLNLSGSRRREGLFVTRMFVLLAAIALVFIQRSKTTKIQDQLKIKCKKMHPIS